MVSGVLLGGRFELGEAIGVGGSGTVFRARDQRSGTDVAVKLVAPGFDAERFGARLRREATVLRRIVSRHVARIVDSGEDVPGTWLAMELVSGVPLSPAALGRPLLPHEVLRVARGLLEGLAATHDAGILHGDVKPANVLVPRGLDGAPGTGNLDAVKLVDFGVSSVREDDPRGARFALEASAETLPPGTVVGTARYLAPEVLRGRPLDARADVYATGLVLFELLGVGPLFPGATLHAQLLARIELDPLLDDRVPSPLSSLLARMLARDPADRFPDAAAVLALIVDLDTAPVSSVQEPPPASVGGVRSPHPWPAPAGLPSLSAPRLPAMTSVSPLALGATQSPNLTASPSLSLRPGAPRARLARLAPDPEAALVETFRQLDVPMLDALARRERASPLGRIARGLALALRVELDAAALALESAMPAHPLARAVFACVLAPRARSATRARSGADRDEGWATSLGPDTFAVLAAAGSALSSTVDAPRDVERTARALDLLGDDAPGAASAEASRARESLRGTLRLAQIAARARSGELDVVSALEAAGPLLASGRAMDARMPALDQALRALFAATLASATDLGRARQELERAHRVAVETGAVLFEVVSSVACGALHVQSAAHVDTGLALLERASALVAHGDTPTLEHAAHHHRASALVARGEWDSAIAALHGAREAARAERAVDAEVQAIATEVVVHLAAGRLAASAEAAALLDGAGLVSARARPLTFAWVARALAALGGRDERAIRAAVDAADAAAARSPDETAEARVLVDAIRVISAAGRGATVDVAAGHARLEALAASTGFSAFHWVDVLRAILSHVDPAAGGGAMRDALERVALVLGRSGTLARDRPTSAPPEPAG